ncbi:3-dehydroquinate synthase [Stratiformator vulcanicus]|uniref:3-dehydroquinate synthase n=1 Tax=Stratiformator vulcanicus TaxID=2527980 RepID=A0A517R129_9PLAN|nr:3-dehydroquinate synthase [Stratiformator vulcanicus]QDT37566.1 3-dehydroquinate synthase [Stratiformator vulcanicus]
MSDPVFDAPQIDVSFSVPFQHRLRFTADVLGSDEHVLLDLLEGSEGKTPRVQFWVDEDVAAANPGLEQRLELFGERHSDRVIATGNVQFVPGGEAVKNDIHILERMLKCMNAADLDRRSYVVVIGGGAVLDAVGFAAAIAHRGIRLIRLPTTTLAQGDSGVGVKNSVNLFRQKNWIGTFAVPWAVINDEALLSTLPDREFVAGFSEAVKVSLLKDAAFFDRVCEGAAAIRERDMEVARPIIRDSAVWHLKHITRGGDPFEALEARPLDYGHWSAHKLEVMTDFAVSHGEAVGIGVAIDTVYSSLKHGLSETDANRVLDCLQDLGLPLSHPMLSETGLLFEGLEQFRQHLGGRLTITMLDGVGRPINVHEIDRGAMTEAIERVRVVAGGSKVHAR